MENLALKTARALERERAALLGVTAQVLLKNKSGTTLKTIAASFMVVRKSNLTIGEEYNELEIAETAYGASAPQLDQSTVNQIDHVVYNNVKYSAPQEENPMTAARTWKFRLAPIGTKTI